MSATIHFEYTRDSLAGIDASDYETELEAALLATYPDAEITIQSGGERVYGFEDDKDIPSWELRGIANAVFEKLCRG